MNKKWAWVTFPETAVEAYRHSARYLVSLQLFHGSYKRSMLFTRVSLKNVDLPGCILKLDLPSVVIETRPLLCLRHLNGTNQLLLFANEKEPRQRHRNIKEELKRNHAIGRLYTALMI